MPSSEKKNITPIPVQINLRLIKTQLCSIMCVKLFFIHFSSFFPSIYDILECIYKKKFIT